MLARQMTMFDLYKFKQQTIPYEIFSQPCTTKTILVSKPAVSVDLDKLIVNIILGTAIAFAFVIVFQNYKKAQNLERLEEFKKSDNKQTASI